jgi:redox-sensitive bicupin YhaK (pirin superfamily)
LEEEKRRRWCLLASPDAAKGSLLIHQDASVYATLMTAGEQLKYPLASARKAYLHVVRGAVRVDEHVLQTGDAAMLSNETGLRIGALQDTELLLFDLA